MSFFTTKAFLNHLWAAKRWSAFHSPYLFSLVSYCCDEKNHKPVFDKIERWRKQLITNNQKIQRTDFGAGSGSSHTFESISGVARQALSLPFQCRFIGRLVEFAKVHSALEFGTCLGISAAYMQAGNPDARIITVEGDQALARIATDGFEKLGMKNIQVISSTFEHFLETGLADGSKFDFIFLDGNHRSAALLHYFKQLKNNIHEGTIVMVDDIYWSPDMQEGWKTLIQKPEVTQSVDCFHFGLLFFKKDFLGKENHKVRLPLQSIFA